MTKPVDILEDALSWWEEFHGPDGAPDGGNPPWIEAAEEAVKDAERAPEATPSATPLSPAESFYGAARALREIDRAGTEATPSALEEAGRIMTSVDPRLDETALMFAQAKAVAAALSKRDAALTEAEGCQVLAESAVEERESDLAPILDAAESSCSLGHTNEPERLKPILDRIMEIQAESAGHSEERDRLTKEVEALKAVHEAEHEQIETALGFSPATLDWGTNVAEWVVEVRDELSAAGHALAEMLAERDAAREELSEAIDRMNQAEGDELTSEEDAQALAAQLSQLQAKERELKEALERMMGTSSDIVRDWAEASVVKNDRAILEVKQEDLKALTVALLAARAALEEDTK